VTIKRRVYEFLRFLKIPFVDSSLDVDQVTQRIYEHNWLQGCIFPSSAHPALQKLVNQKLLPSDACILISQSCNIVCNDFDREPHVEIIIAQQLSSKVDGNFTSSRSPRQLHFHIEIGDKKFAFEALAKNKFNIPRQLLATIAPCTSSKTVDLNVIVAWLVARYDRTAFPDTFNNRIDNATKEKLKKQFAKLADVSSVYIALNSWEELAAAEPYLAVLVFVMPVSTHDDEKKRSTVTAAITQIEKLLNSCPDIVITDCELRSEADFTLNDARYMQSWDDFTYLSHRVQNSEISAV
jgi:hypothetical protein